ncbi:hypothetical protein QBC40DRAFT_280234 [Triangularia verruculosa]|uniref:Pre-mRNA-splicing factor 38B n=1 Tax=Triangularia verruculosa TaxID=2587418 RepID=A0AAN7AT77_9PEZI|nr:hypothetical protein QBC40DRAFT_280234 [Triangularia verruculosa]
MANHTLLTDDYVAGLLAKEASEASIKYSSVGLEAFRSTKPANKAKPNTNFLGRIIKETTNHNKALLAKEAAEAQALLQHHNEVEEKKRQRLNPTKSDIRRRQLGAISSILQGGRNGGERSRTKPDRDSLKNTKGDREREDRHSSSTKPDNSQGRHKNSDEIYGRRSRRNADDDAKSSRHRRSARSRSRSPGHRERRERRHRERSILSSGSDDRHHHNSRSQKTRCEKDDRDHGSQSDKRRNARDDDSDPLDEFIGPAPPTTDSLPPVRIRGRGAGAPRRGAAAMDSRFAEDYDPRNDVSLEGHLKEAASTDSNTWDSAVELYRDRQKWKQQGADRLRGAGFTEEQIKKWEKGGKESEDDAFKSFKYTKKGELREWDRGKSLSDSEMD